MITLRNALFACSAAILTACGSDSTTSTGATSTARGTLQESPPLRIASVDAPTFAAQLGATTSGAQLLEVTGAPQCGVDFYDIAFWTVGSAGETTESSGALMVPTGAAPHCSGPRPILLYAHGTQTDKSANIANITDPSNTEGALIAAMFAAQGYIVVAPNYAGYDISTLGYHPFLYAAQQSGELIDALSAARTALPTTFASGTTDAASCSSRAIPRAVTSPWRPSVRCSSPARPSRPRGRCRSVCARGFRRRGIRRHRQRRWHHLRAADHDQLPARVPEHLQRHQRRLQRQLRDRHRYAAAEHHADHDAARRQQIAADGAV